MQKELSIKKHPRLKEYDYSSNGAYFITICVKNIYRTVKLTPRVHPQKAVK